MGYSMSWTAFRGRPWVDVLGELRLQPTGHREELPESAILGAVLPGGWRLLLANGDERFTDPVILSRLSSPGEAVACFVEEHVMVSHASGWTDGRCIWAVDHDGSEGSTGGVKISGTPPSLLAPIVQALEEQQRQGDADYLFDVPVELAKALVGFRHDETPAGAGEDLFEVLSAREDPKKGLWAKLFGR